jgi:hypothetical protein
MVKLSNGMEMKKDLAVQMGLVDANAPQVGHQQDTTVRPQQGQQQQQEQKQDQQQQQKDDTAEYSTAQKEAQTVLDTARQSIGEDAVSAALQTVARSGDVEASLPEGVTPAQAQSVVQAYTELADALLAPTNTTVNMLTATLSPSELQSCRKATISKDQAVLKAHAKLARERLAAMPERDPEGFRRMLDTYYPELDVRKDGNGRTIVLLDGEDNYTSWGAAVLMNEVKF